MLSSKLCVYGFTAFNSNLNQCQKCTSKVCANYLQRNTHSQAARSPVQMPRGLDEWSPLCPPAGPAPRSQSFFMFSTMLYVFSMCFTSHSRSVPPAPLDRERRSRRRTPSQGSQAHSSTCSDPLDPMQTAATGQTTESLRRCSRERRAPSRELEISRDLTDNEISHKISKSARGRDLVSSGDISNEIARDHTRSRAL